MPCRPPTLAPPEAIEPPSVPEVEQRKLAAMMADGLGIIGPGLAAALDACLDFLTRYVRFPSRHEPIAATLWVAHAHAFEAAEVSPYLAITSAEKRSGKTRLLDALELVVPRPWRAITPSEAVVFRKVEADRPTLLLDEIDLIFGSRPSERTEGLRAILNAGNRRGTTVPRVTGEGKRMRVQDFAVYCPNGLRSRTPCARPTRCTGRARCAGHDVSRRPSRRRHTSTTSSRASARRAPTSRTPPSPRRSTTRTRA